MVIGNLAVSNYHVMREHSPHGLVKSTAEGFVRYLEILEEANGSSGIVGETPAAWYSSQVSVSMKLSGWTGQAARLTIGMPAELRKFQPR
jgi:hypothetical protein